MSFPKFVDSVKRFLTHYLDMSQDREEEAASVEAIRAGVEFKGSTILILVFAIFIASLGLNTNSAADYRRYVDFTSDGSHHGYRIGVRYQ